MKADKVKKLSDTRTMLIYKLNHSPGIYSKIIYEIDSLEITKIDLIFAGEEMRPDKKVSIKSREELLKELKKDEQIAICYFSCVFGNGSEVIIVVDYESGNLKVTCPSDMVVQADLLVENIENSI